MITHPKLPPKIGYVEVEVDGVRRYRNIETGLLYGQEPDKPTTEDRVASLETETETLKNQVKTIADNDKINSSTYIGTGLYGESNPNSVRPNIPAKVLMIIQNNKTILTLSRTESTDEPFVWFASSAKEQCNENGLDYNWIAVS